MNTDIVETALASLTAPTVLEAARVNCSTPWTKGTLNPAPGTVHGDTGTYLRSGEFARTLELNVVGSDFQFRSPATSFRRRSGISFNYGQGLIEGWPPFKGPYKLLPPEYY